MDQEKQKINVHRAKFKEFSAKLILESERPTARIAKGLIWHNDRGSQYASGNHRTLLQQHGITQRMSREGDCRDNAVSGLKTKQDRSTSSLIIGVPSVTEGFFCMIRAWNSQTHTSQQLHQHDITQGSIGSKGNCRDNTGSKSIFHTPITEPAHHQCYQIGVEPKRDVFEYIASFGNHYSSPDGYEMQSKPA